MGDDALGPSCAVLSPWQHTLWRRSEDMIWNLEDLDVQLGLPDFQKQQLVTKKKELKVVAVGTKS